MPDASPTKWHRAHTSWFFETFLLEPFLSGYRPFDPAFRYLFNSYYEGVGARHPRPQRGLLSRPGVEEINAYRAHVEAAMERLLLESSDEIHPLVEIGLHHEQQHQELILTDIKHALWMSPLKPVYVEAASAPSDSIISAPEKWVVAAGLYDIGHAGEAAGFAFDNEMPAHKVLLRDVAIANRPVSNAEFLAFIEDGGYRRAEFWLSDGWSLSQNEQWEAPAYWLRDANGWSVFTLNGVRPVRGDEPVCHVSFYEAAAFAAWRGQRLPTEAEWEVAARQHADEPHAPHASVHPGSLQPGVRQDVWEWTASSYSPYPGYRASAGALGEYNGKFMINQMVLRGRSCATPHGHDRLTYRHFFPPHARWQFSGFRLAEDL